MLRWLRLVLSKDNIFLLLGGGGLVNEFFVRSGPERETVILACLALMGVPYVRNVDKRKNEDSGSSSDTHDGTDS
jgi:hypothetical protein